MYATRPQRTPSQEASRSPLANQRLRASGYPPLWNLTCEETDGVLTIQGVVPSYYLKQIALAIVMNLREDQEVDDLVEVR